MSTETQVIIASPTVENQQALATRIEETVQMSTYQIKKALQAERDITMERYKELTTEEMLHNQKTQKIFDRVIDLMRAHLINDAVEILSKMDRYFGVGEEKTYFDDNREKDVPLEEIARAIVHVDTDIQYNPDSLRPEKIYVHGRINFFGSIEGATEICTEDCVFHPENICESFDITKDEQQILTEQHAIEDAKYAANRKVNEIDLKLKNMSELTEDIRYAMLVKKNAAQGDTDVTDIANKISQAYIQGIDPSIALLK